MASLYQAEHCNISVSFSEKTDESASATAEVSDSSTPILNTSVGGNLDDSRRSVKGDVQAFSLYNSLLDVQCTW